MTAIPQVSVLLPCYNAVTTLDFALESLRNQTLRTFEIIAVDDGSTDGTAALLSAWQAREPRLQVITQAHRGIIVALNTGLKACQAGYIARMDSDDMAAPERLERQVTFLDDHPQVALVSCLVEGFPPQEVRQGFKIYMDWQNSLISDAQIRREIFVESPFPHPSVTMRRYWLERVGNYQERGWAEDYDLWLRLYLAGARFGKLPEVLLGWREHPGRLTRTDGRYSLENFLRLKAYYLTRGPLQDRDAVLIWGAGMVGRRLSKHLLRENVPLEAFIDIDPRKIGHNRRGRPVLAAEELMSLWEKYGNPVLLVSVGARGARQIIRQRLDQWGLREGEDWWSVA